MSSRILRENICDSATIDACTPSAECFYYRLLVVADDYGLMDARLPMLRSRCYPLRDKMAAETIQVLIDELAQLTLILLYTVGDRPFLAINKWDQHQRIQTKKPKYPFPPPGSGHLLPYMKESERKSKNRKEKSKSTVDYGESPKVTVDHGNPPLARAPARRRPSRPRNPSTSTTTTTSSTTRSNTKSKALNPPLAAQAGGSPIAAPKAPPKQGTADKLPASALTWEAYRAGFNQRYGVDPPRNGMVNGMLTHLVGRLGRDLAPQVAGYFLTRSDPYYAKSKHSVKALVADAEKLATEFQTGHTYQPETGNRNDLNATRAKTIAGLTGPTDKEHDDS